MDISVARQFIRSQHRGVLMTYKRDGTVQSSPVVAAVDDSGAVVISSREPAYKVRNLRRDPRAAYCGFNDGFFGDWLQIDGTAEIVSLPDAMEGLVDYYRATAGEHPDWDEYRAAMESQRRVLIRISIEKAGPDRSG
ncbi:MAG TPA: PPOX class F420-dependent oxidoreductase [Mycobacteriales bacterium]|jgi:PPOX class probable F420-dependent enzyme|nr:PPOX class F420-dependent oxidoreductase [Mycobacteriales bacterium]